MKRVSEWETSDGKRWTNQTDAKEHETVLGTLSKLAALLEGSIQTGRVESILRHIVAEQEQVRAILVGHAMRMPRRKIAKEEDRAAA